MTKTDKTLFVAVCSASAPEAAGIAAVLMDDSLAFLACDSRRVEGECNADQTELLAIRLGIEQAASHAPDCRRIVVMSEQYELVSRLSIALSQAESIPQHNAAENAQQAPFDNIVNGARQLGTVEIRHLNQDPWQPAANSRPGKVLPAIFEQYTLACRLAVDAAESRFGIKTIRADKPFAE